MRMQKGRTRFSSIFAFAIKPQKSQSGATFGGQSFRIDVLVSQNVLLGSFRIDIFKLADHLIRVSPFGLIYSSWQIKKSIRKD
jgi:hypothetical protein